MYKVIERVNLYCLRHYVTGETMDAQKQRF